MKPPFPLHEALRHVWWIGLLLALLALDKAQADSPLRNIELPSGEEVTAEVFAGAKEGDGNDLRVLWIAPSFGIQERHRQVAQALAQKGMEVWQVDLAEALFLPRGTQTLRDISPTLVAELITALADDGRSKVLIISNGYGAIPTLRGIHAWQMQAPKRASLLGVILFSPYFYTHVPQLGSPPVFIPELEATNVPIYIFQATKNGNRWYLPAAAELLQRHAPVYTELLRGVTSLFYQRDTAPETLAALDNTPRLIGRALTIVRRHKTPRQAVPLPSAPEPATSSGLDAELKPYRGIVKPQPFALEDVDGKPFALDDFRGRVTVVNFWASWCPPCVKEIPSLNRLRQEMQGQPFQLISINYAEPRDRIREFLRTVAVDFPVLLDPEGRLTERWKIIAFPSTYVIGPDGEIAYGANAAIHWDSDKVIQQLKLLVGRVDNSVTLSQP